ncbi:MAG TPA: zeta toxin family protein [Pyrinomonadaceae bacterium]|jgi:predicted ABC-type ATPase
MSKPPPLIVVIAGPNGAGKSTFAARLLPSRYGSIPFLNADDIARDLSPADVEGVAFEAGSLMLARVRNLIDLRRSFAFETTLAGRKFARRLRGAGGLGYRVHLFFLRLADAELAVARVRQRVSAGGHNIPEDEVRRRYARGGDNFFELYRPLAHEWYVYNNSDYYNPGVIAAGRGTALEHVFRPEEWSQFSRSHE